MPGTLLQKPGLQRIRSIKRIPHPTADGIIDEIRRAYTIHAASNGCKASSLVGGAKQGILGFITFSNMGEDSSQFYE